MEVAIKKISDMGREINLTLNRRDLQHGLNFHLRELAKTTTIAGFRKGRAPLNLLENRYGDQIKDQIMLDLLKIELPGLYKEQNLVPLMEPVATNFHFESGRVDLYLEVNPENAQSDLAGVSVLVPKVVIDDEDIENYSKILKYQFQKWESVQAPAEEGFRLHLHVHLFGINGDERQELEHQFDHEFPLVLNPASLENEAFEALLGSKEGDTVHVLSAHPHLLKDISADPSDEKFEDGYEFQIIIEQVQKKLPGEYTVQLLDHLGVNAIDDDVMTIDDEMVQELSFAGLKVVIFRQLYTTLCQRIKNLLIGINRFEVPRFLLNRFMIMRLLEFGLKLDQIELVLSQPERNEKTLEFQLDSRMEMKWWVIDGLIAHGISERVLDEDWENQAYPEHWELKQDYQDYDYFSTDEAKEVSLDPSRKNTLNCMLENCDRQEVEMSVIEFQQWLTKDLFGQIAGPMPEKFPDWESEETQEEESSADLSSVNFKSASFDAFLRNSIYQQLTVAASQMAEKRQT